MADPIAGFHPFSAPLPAALPAGGTYGPSPLAGSNNGIGLLLRQLLANPFLGGMLPGMPAMMTPSLAQFQNVSSLVRPPMPPATGLSGVPPPAAGGTPAATPPPAGGTNPEPGPHPRQQPQQHWPWGRTLSPDALAGLSPDQRQRFGL